MKSIGKLKVIPSGEMKKTRVGLGFECLDRELFDPDRCYDLAAMTGVKLVRLNSGWVRTEKVRGVYDFSWLDDIVDNLSARGMIPWFTVGYGNPIYMDDIMNETASGCVPLYYGDEVLEAWKNYVAELARHFKGRVTHYEIWNESDISVFWYPKKANPEDYAKLISLSGKVIKSEDPDAKIGACTSQSRPDFIYRLLSGLKPEELDFYCPHNYDRFPERSVRAERTRMLCRMMKDMGFENTDIWLGECGHASWHPEGHSQCQEGGGSEHRQAVWHLRRFFHDLADGLSYTSVFMVSDLRVKGYYQGKIYQKMPAAQGILDGVTYKPKESHRTLSHAAVALSGECVRCEPIGIVEKEDDDQIVTVSYTRNGNSVMAYWIASPVEAEVVEGSCTIVPYPLADIKDPVLIDMFTGEVLDPEGELTNLPIREYPILFADRNAFEIVT